MKKRKIIKQLFASLVILFTLLGCKLTPLPFDHDAQSQSVNSILICAKEIDVFPLSINGMNPPKEAFDYAMKKLKKYTTDNVIIHKTMNLTIEKNKINDFVQSYGDGGMHLYDLTKEDADKFVKLRKKASNTESSIVMIYTPELIARWDKKRKLRGYAFNHSDKTNIVAYNAININNAPVISNTQAWKIVLTHEIGHRFHIPAKSDHNKAGHCTSRECVMYAQPDWQAVVSVIFNGMPYDFCDKCKAELREAKNTCSQ